MDDETIENAIIVYRLARVLFLEIRDEYEKYSQTPAQHVRPTRYTPPNNTQLEYRPALNAAYMNNHPEEQNRYRTIQESVVGQLIKGLIIYLRKWTS